MNGVTKEEVDLFVGAVSGKHLSVRDIEQLAHGFFRGPEWFRQEILGGNAALVLERMRQVPENAEGCNEFERVFLKDLESAQRIMLRVVNKSLDRRLAGRPFCAQANLLTGGILTRLDAFTKAVRQIHDWTGKA